MTTTQHEPVDDGGACAEPWHTPWNTVGRDGTRVTLRRVEARDARDLMEQDHAVVRAQEGVVRTVEDLDGIDRYERNIATWLPDQLDETVGCFLVPEVEWGGHRRVVGEATVRRIDCGKLRHVASLGVAVHPEWQRRGLARLMMNALIAWVERGPGRDVIRLELNVVAENHRATALYESLGFKHESCRKWYLRESDGRLHNDPAMVRFFGPDGSSSGLFNTGRDG